MWLAKPLYELMPYYYMALGVIAEIASFYLNAWYWSEILAAAGAAALVGGLALWLKRRDYRLSRSRSRLGAEDQA